jgi:hypothetical protein
MRTWLHALVLLSVVLVFGASFALLSTVIGITSPWLALLLMFYFLGIAKIAEPLYALRMPSALYQLRPWEQKGDSLRRLRVPGFGSDISAGLVVAMMMIPQGMAYALVAGLPPVAGIYASIVPPLLYALFGTSSTQSVGPMAIISLMTASVLAPLAAPGSGAVRVLAAQLALLSGAGAAGLRPAAHRLPGQLLFASGDERLHDRLGDRDRVRPARHLLGAELPHWHGPSAALGLGALALLLLARSHGAPAAALRPAAGAADIGARLAPMLLVAASCWWRHRAWPAWACAPPARCRPACRT